MSKLLRPYVASILLTVPGLILHFYQGDFSPILLALAAGFAILGASFLLTWTCEAGQLDMPQALAIAVVAFIAVLPEYAVDMYFTWMAGQHPESTYSHFAVANMTGANRLLIGLGWSVLVLIFASRFHKGIRLRSDKRTEIFFLGLATLYALFISFKASLTWVDGCVLLSMYFWYMIIIYRRHAEDEEVEGPALLLAGMQKKNRIKAVVALFVFSALVILLNAEPFSENLVKSGKLLGINEFLLVQWLAPIASEAPEFIVSIMFAMRGNAGLALGSLLASKLNQWTLLVGMIPWVYAVSAKTLAVPMNLDAHQFQEILLTAAQSYFAISLILNLHLHKRQAIWLLLLFLGQLFSPLYEQGIEAVFALDHDPLRFHFLFTCLYLFFGTCVFIRDRKKLLLLPRGVGFVRRPH